MAEYKKKLHKFSIVKNITKQQLGQEYNKQLIRYYTTLNGLRRLRPTLALEHCFAASNKQISELQFNRKGNLIANVYWGNDAVQIWDWTRRKIKSYFHSGHIFTVKQVNWLPIDPENLIVTSGQYGDIRLMDITANQSRLLENSYFENEENFSGGYKFCVNENLPYTILAGSQQGKIINIDIREKKPEELMVIQALFSFNVYEICSIDINPSKWSEFCVGGQNDIRVYDIRNLSNTVHKISSKTFTQNYIYYRDKRRILNAKYNHTGSEILAAYSEDPVYIVNPLKPLLFKSYSTKIKHRSKSFNLYNVHFVGNRSDFIVASSSMHSSLSGGNQSSNIYIWDYDTTELVHQIHLEEKSWRFAVHPELPILAMNLDHSGIRLWQ